MIERFDAADYLDSPEAIAAYLTEALDTDDAAFVAIALQTVARAKSRTEKGDQSAEAVLLSHELSKQAQPEFETIRKVLGELGVRLVVEPVKAA